MGAIHPSLVAWYRGENSAADASGNGNNGTWSGTETYAAGKLGRALSVTADGHVVAAQFTFTAGWSLSLWLNPTSLSGGAASGIFMQRAAAAEGNSIFVLNSSGIIYWDFGGSSGANRWITGVSAWTGSWKHLAFVRSASGRALYVNGVSVASTAEAGTVSQSAIAARIGADSFSTNETAYRYPALFDEVMQYSRALAAHEIRQLYATGSPLGLLK